MNREKNIRHTYRILNNTPPLSFRDFSMKAESFEIILWNPNSSSISYCRDYHLLSSLETLLFTVLNAFKQQHENEISSLHVVTDKYSDWLMYTLGPLFYQGAITRLNILTLLNYFLL